MNGTGRKLGLLLALGLCACTPSSQLVPTQGGHAVRVKAQGVLARLVPSAWQGPPENLPEHFLPLWVQLANRGRETFDVTYGGIQVVDDQARRYPAVPPADVVRVLLGDAALTAPGVRVASAEVASDAPPPLLAQAGFGFGLGPGYDPNDPFNPYGPYPTTAVSSDGAKNVILSGLREGRLLPHTRAAGFVYFPRLQGTHTLRVEIRAASERAGGAPLEIEASFELQP